MRDRRPARPAKEAAMIVLHRLGHQPRHRVGRTASRVADDEGRQIKRLLRAHRAGIGGERQCEGNGKR